MSARSEAPQAQRCQFPGCDQPVAATRGTAGGRRPTYCDDPAHTAATAYRARQAAGNDVPARSAADRESTVQKRAELLHIAAVEFAEHGFHATTVRDLSRAAGLTQPMLYYHVGNKEQFLLSICESLLDLHLEAVSDLANADAPAAERLAEFFERELAEADRHRAEITVYLRERQTLPVELRRRLRGRQRRLEAILLNILDDGAASGELVFDSIDIAAGALWAILNWASAAPVTGHPAMDIGSQSGKLSALVIDGLRPRQSRRSEPVSQTRSDSGS